MLRWPKVRTVIRREYLARVRTKAFWITTLAFPAVLLAFVVLPNLLVGRTGGTYVVALVCEDKALADEVREQLARAAEQDKGNGGAIVVRLRPETPAADAAAQRRRLEQEVLAKRLAGVLVLPHDIMENGKIEYLSTNTSAWRLMNRLERAVGAAVTHLRLVKAGVAADRIDALTRPVDLRPIHLARDMSENAETGMQSFFLSYMLMFLLWMSTMVYGMYVMRGVLEEKASRIVEVVTANLSPLELMTGKILGVGAVGLTQYGIWVVLAMNLAVPGLLGGALGVSGALVSPSLLGFFVLFFVLGYILYSTFYAALGAAFSSEEEAHQMQSIAGWIIGIPFVFMVPVINNPDSTLSVALSLIPFFAPVLFFLRMSVQFPPTWQILLCLCMLLATIAVVARFAAAVYRVGILSYGKRPTVREILRWARAS